MANRSHDAAFSEFVSVERSRLLGAAFLMFGTQRRAEDVVQSSLAYLYGAWPGRHDAPTVALYQILHTSPGRLVLPWQRGERIELVDSSVDRPLLPPGIVTDLADLSVEARRVLILERYIQLPSVQIASLTTVDVTRVHALSEEARASLVARDASRSEDAVLAEQLRDALPYAEPQTDAAAADLAHGRLLVRRRLVRVGALVTALMLAVVVGTWQLVPLVRPAREAAGPVPPASQTPTCDVNQPTCRTTRVREWRNEIAQVTGSYVDPQRSYFSGYTFSYDELYDSRGFWSGGGGALGFDMYRLSEGSTEIYVQIATSPEFAVPCGQITRQRCEAMRFMDGNVFTLSDSTQLSQGLEVQYSPTGQQVITLVARNTTGGKVLDISRGTLIALVQDERLLLPRL